MGESSSDNDTAGEENAIAGELSRSDVTNVSNISNDDNYDAQFTANNLESRGLSPQGRMSAENFAQTTQGGAANPNALNEAAYASMSAANQPAALNQLAANLATIAAAPIAPVTVEREIRVTPSASPFFVSSGGANLPVAQTSAFTAPQVDSFQNANLGSLPQSRGIGVAPVTMQTAPTEDYSDFNFANSVAAQNLQNMANITRGFSPIVDNVVGALSGARGTLNSLNQGFVPRYDDDGNITGVRDISFGSNQTQGYIGGQSPYLTNIYGNELNNTIPIDNLGDDNQNEVVAPVTNPLTGTSRCPEGYRFDEDLQACRLDTKAKEKKKPTTDSELFFRQTALDNAPSNLPGGFDFDAANKRFTQAYAYNPSFYNRPMSTTGFTPFSSFKPFNK